jgi:hypothetical protein
MSEEIASFLNFSNRGLPMLYQEVAAIKLSNRYGRLDFAKRRGS